MIHSDTAYNLTREQVAWAAQHDWFVKESAIFHGRIIVRDTYMKDGTTHSDIIPFRGTFAELRAWAGY